MATLYDREGGGPTTLKTLSELDGLGRPSVGKLRALFAKTLIPGGYAKAAAKTKDGLLRSVLVGAKRHKAAEELLEARRLAGEAKRESASVESDISLTPGSAEKIARRRKSISKFVVDTVRDARCALTV